MTVWTAGFNTGDDIYLAMKADVEFVHPNKLVHVAIFLYQIAIRCLLNKSNDGKRAL